jgi:hypothetical protein
LGRATLVGMKTGHALEWSRRRPASIVFLIAALLACKGSSWKEFTSQEGGFSVLLPGTPKVERRTTESAVGPLAFTMHTVELGLGSVAYIMSYNDYPPSLIADSDQNAILDGVVEGAIGSKANIKHNQPITIDGHPGREFSGTVKDGFEYTSRAYLVKQRLYQLNIVSTPGKVPADDKRKYFESFKLLKAN